MNPRWWTQSVHLRKISAESETFVESVHSVNEQLGSAISDSCKFIAPNLRNYYFVV